jgi:hypothetical protein
MANGLTAEPSMMTPSEIRGSVQERIGSGGDGAGQDFQSWRYNVPQGELGTAYPKSRRKMRMEAEYQQSQLKELERMRALQAMDLEMDREARMQRDQDFQFVEAKTRADREKRVQDEAGLMIDSMRGAVAPDGTVIANPIRPEDDDAIDRLNNLAGSFKYGIENKAAASMFDMLYKDAMKFQESKMEQSKEQEVAAATLSARTGKPMKEFGEYDEQGIFKPNLNAIVGASEELKEKESKKEEERAVTAEGRKAEAQAKVVEDRNIVSQEREIQKEIRRASEDLRKLNASLAGRSSLSETQRASLQAAKDSLLDKQIDKAALRGFVFDDQEGFKKARDEGKIPSGTRAFIGRTAIDIP